jgi:RHS repeat-associated protein
LVYRPSSFHEYNADGLRTKKTTPNGTTQFVYDSATLIAELDGNGNLVAVYTHGATELISQRRGMVSHFYHFDGLGSTMELTDANEAVTDTCRYDAWSNVLSATGTTVNPYRYVGSLGYYFDNGSGLHLLTHRYLDTAVGRFITMDPVRRRGSRYVYVENRVSKRKHTIMHRSLSGSLQ